MKKRIILGSILTMMLATSAFATEPVRLKLASFVSPKSVNNAVSIPEFIKAVEAASEGTLKIDHYPGGTLGSSPKTQLKLVEDGVVDIAEVVASYTPGRFPELAMFELPFEFNNCEEAGLSAFAMYKKGLFTGMENLKVLGIIQAGPYTLHTRKDASSLEKIKNMKLRAGGPIMGQTIASMNAVPIGGIGGPKIAENISRKVLDGALMDNTNLFNFRISDATKYHVLNIQLGNYAVFFPMNKAKYDSLPEKAKAALDTYSGEWFTKLLNKNLDKEIAKGIEKLKKDKKHQVIEWSAEDLETVKAATAHVKDSWNKENAQGVNLYKEMKAALATVRAQAK